MSIQNASMLAEGKTHGSSFLRIPLTAQSYVEKRPPHTPKFPPNTGALALMAVTAPILRSP